MEKNEQYVTEADWAFASYRTIQSEYDGTDVQTIVAGTPKLYPRTIHITATQVSTGQTLSKHKVTVGELISKQPEVVQDAYDTLRFARRNPTPLP